MFEMAMRGQAMFMFSTTFTIILKLKVTLLSELAPLQQWVLEKIAFNEKLTPT